MSKSYPLAADTTPGLGWGCQLNSKLGKEGGGAAVRKPGKVVEKLVGERPKSEEG